MIKSFKIRVWRSKKMCKKMISLFILGVVLVSSMVQISATHILKEIKRIGEKGVFEADIGMNKDDVSKITLSGKYLVKEKIVYVNGNGKFGEKDGNFKGAFKGNLFYLTIPLKSKPLTIFGKVVLNKDDNTFKGMWVGKGIPVKGWITGLFTPIE